MAVTLHIIGCGRVGRVLARLWREAGTLEIGWVLNRSQASAAAAVAFIGAGHAVSRPGPVAPDDWLMLALPEGAIGPMAEKISGQLETQPMLAFHLSGAESSKLLRPLAGRVAAVHPVCPFAEPTTMLQRFAGSHVLGEGDKDALDQLLPAFAAIAARIHRFAPADKRLYHAATIAASNFLAVIDALALDLAEAGGVDPELASLLLFTLQRTALENIQQFGPTEALTGPIERGDRRAVGRLAAAARNLPMAQQECFFALARATVRLAERKHGADKRPADELLDLFSSIRPDAQEGVDGSI